MSAEVHSAAVATNVGLPMLGARGARRDQVAIDLYGAKTEPAECKDEDNDRQKHPSPQPGTSTALATPPSGER
jgi:hypothetical protein